jgi:hypothetical protein
MAGTLVLECSSDSASFETPTFGRDRAPLIDLAAEGPTRDEIDSGGGGNCCHRYLFQRKLRSVQRPKPFNVRTGTDIVDNHPADRLELAPKRGLLRNSLNSAGIAGWCRSLISLVRQIVPGADAEYRTQSGPLSRPTGSWPPRAGQSERWPTRQLHCRGDAAADDVHGTTAP